jgi:hypothetical protein
VDFQCSLVILFGCEGKALKAVEFGRSSDYDQISMLGRHAGWHGEEIEELGEEAKGSKRLFQGPRRG